MSLEVGLLILFTFGPRRGGGATCRSVSEVSDTPPMSAELWPVPTSGRAARVGGAGGVATACVGGGGGSRRGLLVSIPLDVVRRFRCLATGCDDSSSVVV